MEYAEFLKTGFDIQESKLNKSAGIKLFNGDCWDLLKTIPDASIDLMVQDPPYAITQNEWDTPIDFAKMWPEWGATALACIMENRKFIGAELDKKYYDDSVKRIANALSKPGLFIK